MRSLSLILALLPLPVLADCPGDVVLGCQIGQKTLEICADTSVMTYSFGPKGAPEMSIAVPFGPTGPVQPWPGVGRAIWESALFPNVDITYEVWVSIDRMVEDSPLEAGINVLEGEEIKAELSCEGPTLYGNGVFALSDATAAAGYCWDFDAFQWTKTCPQP